MRTFVSISDTHCQLSNVEIPDGDYLIHAGDLTYRGSIGEMTEELIVLGRLSKKFKKTVFICGNHDWLGERNPAALKCLAEDQGLIWLQQDMVELEGIKIWGSAYTPEFNNWAFNLPRGRQLKEKWDTIPEDVDIIVTHGPPHGYGDDVNRWNVEDWQENDLTYRTDHVGCVDLRDRIKQIKPKVHVSGHIHVGYGIENDGNTSYINASICNEDYRPVNKPIIFEIGEKNVRD